MKDEKILEKIYDSALKFLVPTTPQETYANIVKEAIKISGATYGSIALREKNGFKKIYSTSPVILKSKNRTRANTYRAFRDKEPFVVAVSDLAKAHPDAVELGLKWNVFVPLTYQKRGVGVLTLNFTKDEKISKRVLNSLKLFGSLASLAVRKTVLLEESKKALNMRNTFISVAAHELRTPLTSISGYLQLLQKKLVDNTTEAQWVSIIYGESLRLTNLINELIEVNRMQSKNQSFHFEQIDLITVIKEALKIVGLTYPGYSFVFKGDIKKKPLVVGDKQKLIQVFLNILDNSAKFSSSKKNINILMAEDEQVIRVTIQDFGEGIEKKELPLIFDEFYKTNDNHKVGMGVGLYLAKDILKQHHAKIVIKSVLRKGTKVIITFPKLKGEEEWSF